MKRIGTLGSLALALTIGGCSAQQGHQNQSQAANVAPIEPEAALQSEATPKPITGAELLAQQPSQVRAAYKDHDQNGQWATYKTPRFVLYPFSQRPDPIVDCEPLRTTDLQLQAGETIKTLRWAIRSDGWRRRHRLAISDKPDASPRSEAPGASDCDEPDHLHDQAHLSLAAPIARRPRHARG